MAMLAAESTGNVWGQARMIQAAELLLRRRLTAQHAAQATRGNGHPGCEELSLQQMHALMVIRHGEPMTIKDLAESLGVSAPSASVTVDRLVDAGLVTREHSRVDRREVEVRVAPAVAEQMEQLERRVLQSLVEVLEKIGPEYAQMWCGVSEQLLRTLERRGDAA